MSFAICGEAVQLSCKCCAALVLVEQERRGVTLLWRCCFCLSRAKGHRAVTDPSVPFAPFPTPKVSQSCRYSLLVGAWERQQYFSTIKVALSKLCRHGVSHKNHSVFGRFPSISAPNAPLRSANFEFVVLQKEGLFSPFTYSLGNHG